MSVKMNRVATKLSMGALALLLATVPASMALAQDVEGGGRATTDEIMRAAEERMQRELDEEAEREVESQLETETDVTLDQVEDADRALSAEEIDAIQRELEERSDRMVGQLSEIIESDPHAPQRPDWMFQKAEILWELRHWEYLRARNDYNACLDAAYGGSGEPEDCDEPEPEYGDPQALYEEILRDFPDYRRLDEVIFRLGSSLLDVDEGAEAVGYLNRLVNDYPNSRYVPDAHLALGDYFFGQHMTGAAKDNYVAVLDYEGYQNYDYALYQLGWTNFNMGEGHHRASADRFMQVIERADGAWGLLPDRAANDVLLALAELPDGWIEAREYFTELEGIEFAYEQLEKLAGHYEVQGNEEYAVAVYDWLLEEQPNSSSAPDWMDAIARSLRDIDFGRYEERTVEFVEYLHRDGMWFNANQDNERAVSNAELFVESNLQRLGFHYYSEGMERDDVDAYGQAAEYFQMFIDRYPDHRVSFDMNFFLGEIYLYSLEEYELAAQQYQFVVDLYQNDNIPEGADEEHVEALVRDSAYNTVVSYNYLVREHHPESVLVDMAERAGDDPQMTAQGIDEITDEDGETEPIERQDLLRYEEGFVRASDQFSDMYPTEDITPTVDYVAAEIYRSRGHYDNCIPRYESIIQNAPQHTYASFAGNSLLEANYRLERWDEVERWARHLIENEIFEMTPRESLESAIAYAINEHARDLEADGKALEAASELLRLANEFPESELRPGALFNAAVYYERGGRVNDAVEIYLQVVNEHAESVQAPDALYVLGRIHEARADFDRAAGFFERLGTEEYRDAPDAPYAVFNAATLREAMEQWDRAIETYEDYLHHFEEHYTNQEDVEEGAELPERQDTEYHLAYLEQERGNYEDSRDRLRAYLDTYEGAIPLYELVEIHSELGLLAERLNPDDWDLANEHFTLVHEIWTDADRWEEEFGGLDERHAKRHEAAEARFRQSERVFQRFRDVTLEFPPDRLRELANEKADIQQEAEGMYREIIEMGSPMWIAAASYRRGQSYQEFAEQLLALPIPEGLTMEQEFDYIESIEDLVGPLERQALRAFETALELARQARAYNEWSARSAAEISELQAQAFPITSQDGVHVEHSRTEFFSPAPVTELSVVHERGVPRWERLRPPEPEFDIHDPEFDPSEHPDFNPADYPEFNPEDYPDYEYNPEAAEEAGSQS